MSSDHLHPLGLEAVRDQHDGQVGMRFPHPFHEKPRALGSPVMNAS